MITREMLQAGAYQAIHEGRFLGLVMLLVVGGGLFVVQPMQKIYDEHVRERPFITSFIAVVPNDTGVPDVLYSASAEVRVRGTWTACVSIGGRRGCSGSGTAGYGPTNGKPSLWEWSEWLGKNCPVPTVPFALCARYDLETSSGARDISGPSCSVTYTPPRREP